jgi:hypothetical protein
MEKQGKSFHLSGIAKTKWRAPLFTLDFAAGPAHAVQERLAV